MRAFNELRYRRTPRRERGRVEGLGAHMFPLDVLDAWPRLYGRARLSPVPARRPAGREQVLHDGDRAPARGLGSRAIWPCSRTSARPTTLPLSFPIEGWTLALDLPRAAPGLDAALDRLDELVAEAGGRVYLTKDARMRADAVQAMYPRLAEWRAVRDRADPERLWRSDLALRTGSSVHGDERRDVARSRCC